MSLIRGVLLAGKFRTQRELNKMTKEDRRNTLIVEMSNHTNQGVPHFQGMNDETLAGVGAVLVFLRTARIRTDAQLKTMSDDDQRNTLIVEIDGQTHMGRALQGLSNLDLVLVGLGKLEVRDLEVPSYIRGVLLAGKFRTHHELNAMSGEDERNTLIVELTNRSNQNNYQAFNNWELAGMGAILVFLREAGIRTDAQLKTMTADDQRNTMIVEMDGQTGLGKRLQGLTNMQLVQLAMGMEQTEVFKRPIPFGVSPLRIHFKSLIEITDALDSYITTQFESMYELFIAGNVHVSLATIEDLSRDATLQPFSDLDVGGCTMGAPTSEHNQLYAHRNNAGVDDVVVYIVSTLTGGAGNFVGCATHPDGQPGCAIVQVAADWLTAHEVGHVLGLQHVDDKVAANSKFLMWPNIGWTNTPPDLTSTEFQTMIDSALTPIT